MILPLVWTNDQSGLRAFTIHGTYYIFRTRLSGNWYAQKDLRLLGKFEDEGGAYQCCWSDHKEQILSCLDIRQDEVEYVMEFMEDLINAR